MINYKRLRSLLVILLALSMVFVFATACGPEEVTDDPADEPADDPADEPADDPADEPEDVPTELRMGRSNPPDVLNIFRARGGATAFPSSQIYGLLVRWNDNQEYIPYGAESWEVSDDDRTYTFHLDRDNVWHDGEPVIAQDYKMTFELACNPESYAIAYADLQSIVGAEEYYEGEADEIVGIEVIDDYTLSVTTEEPDAVLLLGLMQPVVPHHIFGDVAPADIDGHEYWRKPIGFGPYKHVEYVTDQYLRLEAHEDYVLGEPGIQHVVIDYSDSTNHLPMFERQELDWIRAPRDEMDRVDAIPHAKTYYGGPYGYQVARINMNQERFQDVRVRRAILHAIDRPGILEGPGHGEGEIAHSPFIAPWVDRSQVVEYDYDPDRAKELFDEAGWDYSEPIEILTFDSPRYIDIASIMERNLDAVGVDANITLGDFTSMYGRYSDGDYGFYSGYFMFSADPHTLANCWSSSGARNPETGYQNPRLDELFREGRATLDTSERAEIYGEVLGILSEDAVEIGLYGGDTSQTAHENIVGPDTRGFYHFMQFQDIHNLWEWEWTGPR